MWATARDIARTVEAHVNGGAPLLSPTSEAAARDQVDTRETPDGRARYGFGLYQRRRRGVDALWAWAWGGGYRGYAVMVSSLRWGVVVGANAAWAEPGGLAWYAFDAFFSDLPPLEAPARTDPATWSRYTGDYDDTVTGVRSTVALEGGALVLRVTAGDTLRLAQESGDLFSYAFPQIKVHVQFVVSAGESRARWFALSGAPEGARWPSGALGVSRRVE